MILESKEVAIHIHSSLIYSDILFSLITFTKTEDAKRWLNSYWI
ncbi:MAG: hypothetical protein K0R09_3907 [Clostridiales bacterium]|nr:hypothetical protein [Clostridiales bacterium]